MVRSMRHVAGMITVLLLSTCGAAYISPSVAPVSRGASDVDVVVIGLTPQVVATANASPYTARSLPAAFSKTTPMPARGDSDTLPDAPTDDADRPGQPALRVPSPVETGPYRIGVSDVILLATAAPVTSEQALSGLLAAENRRQGYTVQDDGTIAIPDAGRVRVAGLTVEEAEAQVFEALVEAQMDPTFSLEIAEFNSKRASVGGAVGAPRLVPITLKDVTLGEAVQLAGGIVAPDQDNASIRLFRDDALYQIPLRTFLSSSEYQDITLIDGDAVFVDTDYELDQARAYFEEQIQLYQARSAAERDALQALNTEFSLRAAQLQEQRENFQARMELDAVQRDYVYRFGELVTQGRIALPFERRATLADAIFSDGAFRTATANPSQVYLLRGFGTSGVRAYHIDARNAANMIMATQMQLRPNDFIFVEEQPITKWNRVLTQLSPNLFARDISTQL